MQITDANLKAKTEDRSKQTHIPEARRVHAEYEQRVEITIIPS